MKRLVVLMLMICFLVFSGTVSAQNPGYFETKIGADILGEIEVESGGLSLDDDTDLGITLIGEYKVPLNSQWTVGGGIAYQLERSVDNSGGEDFNFIPIYGLAQYDLVGTPWYLLGHLGYNDFDVDGMSGIDKNGGLYYGLGAGFNFGQYNDYVVEAIYSVNNGELDYASGEVDVEYSKFSICVGKRF